MYISIGVIAVVFSFLAYSYYRSLKQKVFSQSILFGLSLFVLLLFLGSIRYLISWYKVSFPWPDVPYVYEAIVADNVKKGEKVVSFEAYCRPDAMFLQERNAVNSGNADSAEKLSGYRKIRVVIKKDSVSRSLTVGDRLRFISQVNKIHNTGNPREFDSESYWLHKGVSGEVFIWDDYWQKTGELDCSDEFDLMSFRVYFLRLRNHIISLYRKSGLDGDTYSFFAALTLGERKGIPSYINELYSKAGVSHILALSGMHLGFFVAILNFLFLSRIHKKIFFVSAVLFSILVIWTYTFIAGMPASLVRATVMYSIMFLVKLLNRDGFSVNALFVTAFLMLLANPLWLFDVGFQLSFLAMFGILFLYPQLKFMSVWKRNIITAYATDSVAISFCAQVFTVPLVLYYWGTFALYSAVATLLLSPVIALLMCCMPLLCLSSLLLPYFNEYIVLAINFLYSIQESLLDIVVSWPMSVLRYNLDIYSVLLLYVFIIFYLNRRYLSTKFKFRFTVVWTVLLAVSLVLPVFYKRYPALIVYNNNRESAVHVMLSRNRSYLRLSGKDLAEYGRHSSGYLGGGLNGTSGGDSVVSYGMVSKAVPDIIFESGLSYISKSFWEREGIDVPVVIDDKYKDEYIQAGKGFIYVNGIVSLLIPSSSKDTVVYSPDIMGKIDYFIIDKYYKGHLTDLLRHASPKMVVLDATLSKERRNEYAEECERLNFNVYDIEKQGALKVILK